MNISDLPKGNAPAALAFEHFPSRQQAFVWRNWGMLPVERLAAVLDTSSANVCQLASDMGLAAEPQIDTDWLGKGYVTIIRQNWHLLPYEQLLTLLGWSAEKLDYTLREDDFLYTKLGNLKPRRRLRSNAIRCTAKARRSAPNSRGLKSACACRNKSPACFMQVRSASSCPAGSARPITA